MAKPTTSPHFGIEAQARVGTVFMIGLRLVFVLVLGAVGWSLAGDEQYQTGALASNRDLIIYGFLGAGLIVIAMDIFVPRKSLTAMSGLFFGLVVGMVAAYGLGLIIDLLVASKGPGEMNPSQESFISAVKLALGVVCCYLAVSFILQTKDDVRFVIPYVEFAKETKGTKPFVLDTSVIVDGRIADVAASKIIEAELIVPRFVLHELQTIADSSDKLKRTRGRRGLDMLNKLQASDHVDVRILDVVPEKSSSGAGVDEMLVDLSLQLNGKIVTNDYNLNKIAQLRGVTVINVNDLSNALKPVVLPGEALGVKIVKPGEEPGQGVGYLDDGTMVVVEGARDQLGDKIQLTVTSVLQTSAGRMIFGRLEGGAPPDRRRPRSDRPERPEPDRGGPAPHAEFEQRRSS